MEALQLNPQKSTLTFTSLDLPVITKPDEVIIKVAYAGICGTDLHIIEGKFPSSQRPFTLGHEFSGTVYEIGSEVQFLKSGDRVAVNPNSGCGLCRFCHSANYHICPDGALNSTIGIFFDGGWAQYCKVSSKQVYKLPSNITLKQAVLLEPLSCVYYGYSRISPINHGNSITVNGAGIIGNLWCTLLHHTGHRNVIVSEPEKDRRQLMEKLETGYQILNPIELKNNFSSDGVNGIDVCIDCSGNGSAIEKSVQLLNRGGKLCVFGVASPETRISVSPFEIFLKEITVFGVTINRYSFQHAIGLMEAMGSRYIDFGRLGIEIFSLNQYKEAIEALHSRKISKAVFRIGIVNE